MTRSNLVTLTQIKDIKGSEQVLSLNEETGKIEPHKIKGLLDMGIQPVYKLTTEDGKTIRTTGNHPYLVKKKELTVNQSDSGSSQNGQFTPQAGRSFESSQEGQNYPNNFTFTHLSDQDNNNAGAFMNIESEDITKTPVKAQQNPLVFNSKSENSIIIATGKAGFSNSQNINSRFTQAQNNIGVDTLIGQKFEDHNLSGAYFQNFLFFQNAGGVAESNFSIFNRNTLILSGDVFKAVTPLEKVENISNGNSGAFNTGFAKTDLLLNDNTGGSGGFDNVVHKNNYNSSVRNLSNVNKTTKKSAEADLNLVHLTSLLNGWPDNLVKSFNIWTKVIYLKAGDEIAVANFSSDGGRMDSSKVKFVKIKSIEELPAEQVYDIEVEGTHNFVANGIVAHNTYISGNTGIGTTNPTSLLSVGASSQFQVDTNGHCQVKESYLLLAVFPYH